MSRVDIIAETLKLARLVAEPEHELAYLEPLGGDRLRELRHQVSDALFDDTRAQLERVASSSGLLPASLNAKIAERFFGPMLCARMAGLVPPERGAKIAGELADGFLANVSVELDPRSAEGLLSHLPTHRIVSIATVLLARGDYVTMGRFVDVLSLDVIAAVANSIERDADLLEIAFFVETKSKISDLADVLPEHRMRGIVVHAGSSDGDAWVEALALMSHLNEAWRTRIGQMVVDEGEEFLTKLIDAAHTHDLWDAMLPIVAAMTDECRRALACLGILDREGILERVVTTASEQGSWSALLPLMGHLSPTGRAVAARVAVGQLGAMADDEVRAAVATLSEEGSVVRDAFLAAAQDTEHWPRLQVLLTPP